MKTLRMKKTDIILAGVGGQGILTIAAALGYASLHEDLFVKQSEVHGMSQRGGAVQSHLRISASPIASDLIPQGQADLILSVEPMEGLRYLPYLNPNGWLVTNSVPFINIPGYPAIEQIESGVRAIVNNVWIDADQIARDYATLKASNMVMLGAASHFIHIASESLKQGIISVFKRKGSEVVDLNLKAFEAGRASVNIG